MDRSAAATLLRREIELYAQRSRPELVRLIGGIEAYEVTGPDGIAYQVEVDVRWDTEPGGLLRVIASIDDGGFRSSLRPVTAGFLLEPDGTIEMADPRP